MTLSQAFFFIAGMLAVLAVLFVLYPWLAGKPRMALLETLPRWVPVVGIVALAVVMALYLKLGTPQLYAQDAAPERATPERVTAEGARVESAAAAVAATPTGAKPTGGSMDSVVAGLERRLASGGGNEGDWELLAKSYDFLGRPADAAAARQKRLPTGSVAGAGAGLGAAVSSTVPVGASVGTLLSGEVVLSDSLRGKVPPGLTLFIVAKSVNSPGAPVAILRTTTDKWPVIFRLDDSMAMMPARNLSSAGTVTIEARTSQTGQAMPAPGDFQGVTTPLDPSKVKSVRVVIGRVIG